MHKIVSKDVISNVFGGYKHSTLTIFFVFLSLWEALLAAFSLELYVFSSSWEIAAAAKLLQSCPTQWDPIDGSPVGSSVPGILQARILEWVAISFSIMRDYVLIYLVIDQFWF